MRGKVFLAPLVLSVFRITPAYAGKRERLIAGENDLTGSPPPMRGKVNRGATPRVCGRITPAYAGKSTQILWNCFFDQDHPRLCGEKRFNCDIFTPPLGSPPPMRGKANNAIFPHLFTRDHPRLCGEKSGILRANAATIGSPPPMRGKATIVFLVYA